MPKETPELSLVTAKQQEVARIQPTALDMIQSVIERGVTSENVAALRELVALKRDMDKDQAERDFARAFVALQADLPTIVAKTVIPNRGKYERFEDVMNAIAPAMRTHGFSVSFAQTFQDSRIIETCTLFHVGGFSKQNSFAVRVGRADSETQADCKAATTAKRNALLNALNIVIRQDCLSSEESDATLEGDPNARVTQAQADELERRVHESNSNVHAFLKFCGAGRFEDIPAVKYDELDAMLARKEKGGR